MESILITIALAAAALVILYGIVTYNRLVRGRNLVREGWSGIDVQLKRRQSLVPNLVQLVKGYAAHERGTFEEVAQLRGQAAAASGVQERANMENDLSQAIRRMIAVGEAYPALKASGNFLELQKQLAEVEDEIQLARRYYNGTVRDFNTLAQSFPSNIVASVSADFAPREFFEIETATEREVPDVEIS